MPVYYNAAKINLFLQVEGKRPDGYHELTSVMQSVSLFDRVEVDFGLSAYALDCGSVDLGPAAQNIATRMWRLLQARYDLSGEIAVKIRKKIPVGAGLAGGSGNGAAVLRAVVDHYGLKPTDEEIIELSRAVGADVAFCYYGGTMLARGIGEKLKPLKAMPAWDILLFDGGFHVSTPEIFRAYDEIALGMEAVPAEMMLHALDRGSKEGILYSLYNGLEKVTFPRYAALRRLSNTLNDYGIPHLMSGSGPTVFALVSPEVAKNLLKEKPSEFGSIYHAFPVTQGVFCEEEFKRLSI